MKMAYLMFAEANRQNVKFAKIALNHLQEPRDIKITQCKHEVRHFYWNSLKNTDIIIIKF